MGEQLLLDLVDALHVQPGRDRDDHADHRDLISITEYARLVIVASACSADISSGAPESAIPRTVDPRSAGGHHPIGMNGADGALRSRPEQPASLAPPDHLRGGGRA